MTANAISTTLMEQQSILERSFNAPRPLVFKMFTDPEHLKKWWNPDGWTIPVCTVDFRVGGVWHYCMKSIDDGTERWVNAVYSDIVEPERIVYKDTFVDGTGKKLAELPERLNRIIFTELDNKTKLTMDISYYSRADLQAMLDVGMVQGITESWNRLEKYLTQQK